ncbi:hypothetical protein C8R42DRAFT_578887, partial [Lentinula raphanica]
MPFNQVAFDSYPTYGILPGFEDRIVYDHNSSPDILHDIETSGFDQHPADLLRKETNSDVLIERSGIVDPERDGIPARFAIASALTHIASHSNSKSNSDPVSLHYGADPIAEYNNKDLFPGMFPTLFPLGIGGFEDSRRSPQVSMKSHAAHLLDQCGRAFRYHHYYIFVALNILQRRTAHLFASFTVKSSRFSHIAPALLSVSPKTLSELANIIREEHSHVTFTPEQHDAFRLLSEVNTVAAHVPGSQAAKVSVRNDIRSYFGYFGMAHLFLTLNPSAVHSPIFQAFFGDSNVDLSQQFPQMPPKRIERAYRVAKDPVAASDFFDFMIRRTFEDLFGWDFEQGTSTAEGGILGKIRAFYGTPE